MNALESAQLILKARKAKDLTQKALADQLKIPQLMIRKLERAEISPDAQLSANLSAVLGVSFSSAGAMDFEDHAHTQAQGSLAHSSLSSSLTDTRVSADSQLIKRSIDEHTIADKKHQPGFKVRGYTFIEAIGRGGFGLVYRARQESIARDVAVKIINPDLANDPEFIRSFAREAELVAKLEHPFIVPLYDFWREPNAAYMVMRYLRGGSLAQMLQGDRKSINFLIILRQIASALKIAHRAGVIHRDLKPGNILLDDQGNACLADFGIARQVDSESDRLHAGDIVGSLAYCSPEQIRGEQVGPASDIYALGLVAFEMFTGRRPFVSDQRETLIYQVLNQSPPLVSEFANQLSERVDAIFLRVLSKEASARFADPLEFVSELETELRGVQASGLGGAIDRTDFAVSSTTHVQIDEIQNPFVGLAAFDEANARNFFGRESLVEELLNRLKEKHAFARVLFVVGSSGSGKSSVVKAGLLPALRAGAIRGSQRWFVTTMLPGENPIARLEQALARVAQSKADFGALLRSGPQGLQRALDRCLAAGAEHELVLVVDQFEELFTLCTNTAEREAWIPLITTALLDPFSKLRVIMTLRADFVDRPLQHVDLAELLRERCVLVPALNLEELERAVVGPAKRVGLVFEPGLVAAILQEADDQIGALPLLQYALSELFHRRRNRELSLASFREMGGIRGALAGRAEVAFASLSASAQAASVQLFLRLTTLGEGREDTRRRALLSEIMQLGSDQQSMQDALDAFSSARVLTFDRDVSTGQPTVEVAHEAMLRSWERLQQWLQNARADLRVQRQLAEAAQIWQEAGQQTQGYLAGSGRLAQFRQLQSNQLVQLTAIEREYLQTSADFEQAQHDAERARQRRELEQERLQAQAATERANLLRRGKTRLQWMAAGLSGILAFAAWQGWQLKQRQLALTQQTARANLEAQNSSALANFWRDLFKSADPNQAGGKELSVREVLDQGLARSDQQLKDAPIVQASLLKQMGESYRALGKPESAMQALDRASAALASLPSDKVPNELRIELGLERGRNLADLARAPEALDSLFEVKALQEKIGAPALERATTLNILASVYNDQQLYLKAEPLLRQTLQLRQQGASEQDLAISHNNLGFTLLRIGHAKDAREQFAQTLALRKKLLGELHTETAIAEFNLATAERDLGQFETASSGYARAGQTLTNLLKDADGNVAHPIYAAYLLERASLHAWQEQGDLAKRDYLAAIEIYRKLFGHDTPATSNALLGLGRVYLEQGKLDLASENLKQALAQVKKRVSGNQPILAMYFLRLAELEKQAGNPSAAKDWVSQAANLLSNVDRNDFRLATDLAQVLSLQAELANDPALLRRAAQLLEPAKELHRARTLLATISPKILPVASDS